MKLKKCMQCDRYTMKELCEKCNNKTHDAHHKFIRTGKIELKKS